MVKYVIFSLIGLIYNGGLIGAVLYSLEHQIAINWCSGTGFLIIVTCIIYFGLIYKFVFKKFNLKVKTRDLSNLKAVLRSKWTKWSSLGLVLLSIIIFVALDSLGNQQRLISLIGLILILVTSYLSSRHHGLIKWRLIIVGIIANYVLSLTTREWPLASHILICAKSKFDQLDFVAYQIGYNVFGNSNHTFSEVRNISKLFENFKLLLLHLQKIVNFTHLST